jgi:hypothetical protein
MLELLSDDVTVGFAFCVGFAQPTPAVLPTTSATTKAAAAP